MLTLGNSRTYQLLTIALILKFPRFARLKDVVSKDTPLKAFASGGHCVVLTAKSMMMSYYVLRSSSKIKTLEDVVASYSSTTSKVKGNTKKEGPRAFFTFSKPRYPKEPGTYF